MLESHVAQADDQVHENELLRFPDEIKMEFDQSLCKTTQKEDLWKRWRVKKQNCTRGVYKLIGQDYIQRALGCCL